MESNNLFLRELEASDVKESYLEWFRDEKVTEFLEVDGKSLTIQDVIDYMELGRSTKKYYMYAICLRENNKHIGNLKVGEIDSKHGLSDLVTVIGDREQWGKGYATEAIKLGNKLAFDKYKIRKLSGGILSSNIGSIKAYTNAGWIIEGKLFNHYMVDGKFQDRIIVSCFNPYFEQ